MTTTQALSSDYWTDLSQSMIDTTIGDYQFVQDLGHGAYGGLFLGQSLQTKSYVAIKVLNKSGLNDQQLSLQQLEMDIQSSLKGHPSLLQLYDVLQDDHYIYMIMELCDQGDLFDFVIQDQDQQQNDYRSESLVKDLYIQILQGIQYMHQKGIYHRDIKLENVLLKTKEGNDEDDDDALICKVADFGLATRDRYSMEFGCGSATYLAPEHFADEDEMNLNNNNKNANNQQQEEELKPYDSAASDIWSLGILLLAFMFGRNPWQEANYTDGAFNEYLKNPIMLKQQLFPNMSMELYQFLTQHILVMDPTQRLSISDMLVQFQKISHLYTFTSEEDEEEDDYMVTTPVDIPTDKQDKNDQQPRYDSAFFSMDLLQQQQQQQQQGASGMSWSDMVEEELGDDLYYSPPPSIQSDDDHLPHSDHDDDDTDMFVHSDEKESWWL